MSRPARQSIDLWTYERTARARGHLVIAGVDEAGRGPLAGPVVAAAVVLPPDCHIEGVFDSKQLTARQRDICYDLVHSVAQCVGVGAVDHEEIDRVNILQATYKAMRMAISRLSARVDYCLVDGSPIRAFGHPHECIVDGDCKSASIAAASIIAKVTRDRIMCEYDSEYPEYGFARHKGYPTAEHLECIEKYGICAIHRRTFGPVARRIDPLWQPQELL
jgi:ribonuclease HII